ncbi:MAG: hypothetical protein AAF674_04855 [Pseudomonadota bacterium]
MGNKLNYIAMQSGPEAMAKLVGLSAVSAQFSELDRFGNWILKLHGCDWTILNFTGVDPPKPVAEAVKAASANYVIISYRAYDTVSFEELVYRSQGRLAWSVALAESKMHLKGDVPQEFHDFADKCASGMRLNRRTSEWVDDSRPRELSEKIFGKPDSYAYLAISTYAWHLTGYGVNRHYDDADVAAAYRFDLDKLASPGPKELL